MNLKRRLFGSLTGRLLALSTAVALLGSVFIVVALGTSYQRSEQRAFRELLETHLLAIVAQTVLDGSGNIIAASDAGFPGFTQPASGWYWQVNGASTVGDGAEVFRSLSLAGADLADLQPPADQNFENEFERFWVGSEGPAGMALGVLETSIFLGDANIPTQFRVSGPTSLPAARVRSFTFWLALSVGTLAAFLIVANILAVRFGLRPLDEISQQISDIRTGERDRIDERVPTEVEPLVVSLNELIAGNKSVVERARGQVGNLAHALKTPLAVLQNEAAQNKVPGAIVSEQTSAMKTSVQRYLDRARIAAGGDGLGRQVRAGPLVERLVRVMQKLHGDRTIEFDSREAGHFVGDAQDYEEAIGNLLENAARHATREVKVGISVVSGMLITTICDDGSGLGADEVEQALMRGRRLDETQPGSGLGLAIAADIADAYGGTLVLDRADIGGLRARLSLPAGRGVRS
ncbi:MAG: HAMP domain-containing sensor histidine kinase [Pseudomonadota bacterium]